MDSSKQLKVSDPDAFYCSQRDDRNLVRTLHLGTSAMRDAGELYLPREQGESTSEYKARLNRSFLYPGVEDAIDDISGRIFRKPFNLDMKGNADLQPVVDDADMSGNHLQRFIKDAFKNGALIDGIAYILIDNPRVTASNLAEQKEMNIRPFMRFIRADDVLGIQIGRIDGVEAITQIRIFERAEVKSGEFGTKHVNRIRVLEPGYYAIYEEVEKNANREYVKIAEGAMDAKTVPIVPIYTERMSFMRGRPPMLNLAWLNVAHWQSSSDQRNILRIGRVPILVASGVRREEIEDDKGNVTIGSSRIFTFTDVNANIRFVEHSGNAISAGAQDLKQLEEKMQEESAQLVDRPGDQTATEAAIKSADNNSWIDDLTADVRRATNEALSWAKYWMGNGFENSPTVDLSIITSGKVDPAELTTLNAARDRGDISLVTYLDELSRRGIFAEGFDPEEEAGKVDEEKQNEVSLSPPSKPAMPEDEEPKDETDEEPKDEDNLELDETMDGEDE